MCWDVHIVSKEIWLNRISRNVAATGREASCLLLGGHLVPATHTPDLKCAPSYIFHVEALTTLLLEDKRCAFSLLEQSPDRRAEKTTESLQFRQTWLAHSSQDIQYRLYAAVRQRPIMAGSSLSRTERPTQMGAHDRQKTAKSGRSETSTNEKLFTRR